MTSRLVFLIFSLFLFLQAQASQKTFEIESQIAETTEKIQQIKLDQKKIETHLQDLTENLKKKKKLFLLKIKDLDKVKKTNWLRFLVESSDPAKLDRNSFLLARLSKADLQLANEIVQTQKQIHEASRQLNEELSRLESSLFLDQQRLDKALDESEKSDSLVAEKSKSPSLIQQKGNLQKPLDLNPLTYFGNSLDPKGQYLLVSKGWTYLPKSGMSVKSISRGQIIFRDVLSDWAETLIIKHDGPYYSVYAGLSQSALRLNQTIEAGAVIGTTRDGEFYFELRHYQNAINPAKWFQGVK